MIPSGRFMLFLCQFALSLLPIELRILGNDLTVGSLIDVFEDILHFVDLFAC